MVQPLFLVGTLVLVLSGHSRPARAATAAAATSCGLQTLTLPLKSCNFNLTSQPVFSWGVLVSVGGTQLCASPSTVVSNCLWESEGICSQEWLRLTNMTERQCRSARGNFLTKAGIATASTADTDSLASQNPNWVSFMGNYTAFDLATTSPLQIQASTEVPMLSGIIDRGRNHSNSHLALDDNSALLRGLKTSGYTNALSFAIDSGSTSYLNPRTGWVTLGGYIPDKFAGKPVDYPMNYSKTLNERRCPLQVTIVEIILSVGAKTYPLLPRSDSSLRSCIEPYDRMFRLSSFYRNLTRDFIAPESGWARVDKNEYGRYNGVLLDLEPGLIFQVANMSNKSLPITMDITLAGSDYKYTIPAEEMIAPLRGLDDFGTPIVDESFREVAVYQDPAPERAAVLGRAFLSQAYLFVDYERNIFKLGPLNKDEASGSAVSSGTCERNSGGLTETQIGLIVLGCVVFFLALAVGFLVVQWWKHAKGAGNTGYRAHVGNNGGNGTAGGQMPPPTDPAPLSRPDEFEGG